MASSRLRVLISDRMSPQASHILQTKGIEPVIKTDITPSELSDIIKDFDGLAVRSSTLVTAETLKNPGRLKIIGRAGIGVDNIDVNAATNAGIIVMNTPFGNSVTTAEHTIAMMMSLARQIPLANSSTQAGRWEKAKFMGQEISGKILGVIGCGNIGAIVADRALGLKMKVLGFDPYLTDERATRLGIEKVSLDTLLTHADFVTIHTPLTEETKGIINTKTLAQMKKGARLINCARGGLVIESDLKAALDSGHIAGAALDVFEEEPAKSNPLFGYDNVICTPHLGASTIEAQEKVALQVAEQMADYLLSGSIAHSVNLPPLSREDALQLKPYQQATEHLGALAGQIVKTAVHEINISYEGQASTLIKTQPLTALLLATFLKSRIEGVNIVNASLKAKSLGLVISETKRESAGDYQSVIRLSLHTEQGIRTLAITLMSNMPRIINIDGMKTEAALSPHMLFILNRDKPGLIGNVGTVLGNADINIANFNLGRLVGQNKAIALISIDDTLPPTVLSQLTNLANVEQVITLNFDNM